MERPSRSHKFTHESFCCTWYETTKTLSLQGKQAEKIRKKLQQALDQPVPLTEKSKTEKNEAEKSENQRSVSNELYENSDNANLRDGLHSGPEIRSLIKTRLKEWAVGDAKISIVTPFLDVTGLNFITSCVDKARSVYIYTREECFWSTKFDMVKDKAEPCSHSFIPLKCKPSFHGKFLAGEYQSHVELVVTSCNMTNEHLFYQQLETLMQSKCTVEEFQRDWIGPLKEIDKNKVQFLNLADLSEALPKPEK